MRRLRWPLPLVLLALAQAAPAAPASGTYDPARPHWSALEFSASKLLMSADASITARLLPQAQVAAKLASPPVGTPVPAGPEVLEMVYRASGMGRDSVTALYNDPLSGATLQRTQLDGGHRQRQRTYRFTDVGAYHFTRWPATTEEQGLDPESWTRREQGLRRYPPGAVGQPVAEPTALLWLAAAAPLASPGERVEILTFSRRGVNRVVIEVTGRRATRVDYEEVAPDGKQRRRGRVDALHLRIRGAPLDPATADDDFELLGLRGDLDLLLDPDTGVPLELRGRVKVVGQLSVRLRRAVLR